MKVTVIIPIYNAADFLTRSVQSAVDQSEVVAIFLIEDGSTDTSLQVAQKLSEQFSKVTVFQHPDQANHGAGASRNLGLEKATTEYIAFLDADDWYLPQRFQTTQKQFTQFPQALGIYEAIGTQYTSEAHERTYLEKVKGRALTTIAPNISPADLFETLLLGKKGWCHLNGFTIKRTLLEQTGFFDQSLRQSQDLDFILKASLCNQLYPGELQTPVAIRGIHGNNRIFDRPTATIYKKQLYEKWFTKMLAADWSKQVNHFLLRTKLSYALALSANTPKWKRVLFKTIYFLQLLFKHPKLLFKLF